MVEKCGKWAAVTGVNSADRPQRPPLVTGATARPQPRPRERAGTSAGTRVLIR
jgi:hypothetical protein